MTGRVRLSGRSGASQRNVDFLGLKLWSCSRPATGKPMNMPFCEVMTYDADGKIVRGELFYDQAMMLVKLGHMPPPPN